MPRLIGHRTNRAVGGGIAVAVVIAIAILLEAIGAIDVIPNFGRDSRSAQADPQLVVKS